MRQTVEFLNAGEKEREAVPFVILDANIAPQTAHSNVRLLLARSKKGGAAFEKIGDYLFLFCSDSHTLGKIGLDKAKSSFQNLQSHIEALQDTGDMLLPFFPDDRYINLQNSAPISIFPFSEAARIKIITGAIYFRRLSKYRLFSSILSSGVGNISLLLKNACRSRQSKIRV